MLLELTISPLDKGESIGAYVARAVDVIDQSGVPYRLHAMGTILEGDWDELMAVVKRCFEALATDCKRISVSIKIDHREGETGRLAGKVRSIEKVLGRGVHS